MKPQNDVIILPSQKNEYSIPQWQIDEVRERTIEYFKTPSIALDFDDVMKDFDNEILIKAVIHTSRDNKNWKNKIDY